MTLLKFARLVGLSLIVSATALTAFAAPPAPQPCSCEYCPRVNSTRSCTLSDGTTTTCGYFLAVTTCLPSS